MDIYTTHGCFYCGTNNNGYHFCSKYVKGSKLNDYFNYPSKLRYHYELCPNCQKMKPWSQEKGYICTGCLWISLHTE